MQQVAHTAATLAALSLKEIAALVNMPTLAKVSKAKAIERALAVLPAPVPEVKKTTGVKIPRAATKHEMLLNALEVKPCTRGELMEASGFDDKNLSVALCNLKRMGWTIRLDLAKTDDAATVRLYSLVR